MNTVGYLDIDDIIERASKGKRGLKNLITVLAYMKWPGESEKLTIQELQKEMYEQAKYMKSKRNDIKKRNLEEIIVLSILESSLPKTIKQDIFGHACSEKALKPPVAKYLKKEGYKVSEEIKIGKSKADLAGVKGSLLKKVVAVELKTNFQEMKRFLDQVTDYVKGADKVYLGTTPYAVIEYASKYGRDWFSTEILEEKLEKVGVGLLVVDMGLPEDCCQEQIDNSNNSIDKEMKRRTANLIEASRSFR